MEKVKRKKYRQAIITVFWVFLLFPIGIVLAKAGTLRSWWFYLLLMPTILIGFQKRDTFSLAVRASYVGLMVSIMLVYGGWWAYNIYHNILNPPVWDFQPFWLNGQVADEGLNFYDAESFYSVAERYLEFDNEFAEEILNPAFYYPPPAMFIFAPLGWLDIRPSAALWYVVQMIFMLLCIYTAWKLFGQKEGLDGLLFVSVMVITIDSSFVTVSVAQLNFMMLLMTLLALKDRALPRAGLWLGLGIIIKPISAILLVYFLLKKQWKTLITTILVLFGLSILTILTYGLENYVPYFTNNPTTRSPDWLFFESGYQSLFSITVKATNFDFDSGTPLLQPIFLIPALLLTLFTLVLVYRIKGKDSETVLYALTLIMALLMYPATQVHYGVLLLIPVFILWEHQSILGVWPSIGVITLIYCGSALGGYLFFVFVFCWLLFAIMAVASKTKQVLPEWEVGSEGSNGA